LWHIHSWLGSDSETKTKRAAIARQQFSKYVKRTATIVRLGMLSTKEKLLEAVFSVWFLKNKNTGTWPSRLGKSQELGK
jgi:hypothetical protein